MKTSPVEKEDNMDAAEETEEEENISYLCMKYNLYQRGDRLACQDPGLYCKFRPSCLIHFKEKQDRLDRRQMDSSDD